jgi:hypothetical protein
MDEKAKLKNDELREKEMYRHFYDELNKNLSHEDDMQREWRKVC